MLQESVIHIEHSIVCVGVYQFIWQTIEFIAPRYLITYILNNHSDGNNIDLGSQLNKNITHNDTKLSHTIANNHSLI